MIFPTLFCLFCLISPDLRAKEFQFFCSSKGWYPSIGKDYYHTFIKSSDCRTIDRRLAITALFKARSICRTWAQSFDIDDKDVTFFLKGKSQSQCQEANHKIDRDFEQRRINRIYSYPNTNYYINNTGIEKPIYLADGNEQPQWIQLGNRRFCGLINADMALLETPQSIIVRILSSEQELSYLRISKDSQGEIFRATSRKFKNAQFIHRNQGLTFFNYNREGIRQSEISFNLSYRDKVRGERFCRPLTWYTLRSLVFK
ncbi:MAG: hypothetical protein HYV97_10550 [Bdellovibrio sp.]|nr:hypothetical protein [Bdellovibrio sp.]